MLFIVFSLAKRIIRLGGDYLGVVDQWLDLKESFLIVMFIASQALWVLNPWALSNTKLQTAELTGQGKVTYLQKGKQTIFTPN